MRITIHRGSKEIGGSCVEFATETTRVLVDFGMPLVDAASKPFDPALLAGRSVAELIESAILPPVAGLYKGAGKGVDAVLISHAHLDHYGLLGYIHDAIPVYMSRGAKELIEVSGIFTPHRTEIGTVKVIDDRRTYPIGDIAVRPYSVDHSAFDAFAFLVSADGKRVFYSGDFRGHGRKSALFRRMIKDPPRDIDYLIMEGSALGRGGRAGYADEDAVCARIGAVLRAATNVTFLFAASQNIDRLVSAYKACRAAGAIFVIDLYTAYLLDRLRTVSKHIPQFDWKHIRVKFDHYQADTLAKKVSTKLLYFYNTRKIDIFEIRRKRARVLMLARDNRLFPETVKGIGEMDSATVLYSMWGGYRTDDFTAYCRAKGLAIEEVHVSGHATEEDLKLFAEAVKPKAVIPIHTFLPERYKTIYNNVLRINDGETVTLPS